MSVDKPKKRKQWHVEPADEIKETAQNLMETLQLDRTAVVSRALHFLEKAVKADPKLKQKLQEEEAELRWRRQEKRKAGP